jgi:predicted GNAT superfamily acetyltransferase
MSAPVEIRILSGVPEQNLAREIFDEVWPTDEGTQITANLMQAMVHNGAYVSGAFIGDEIVAAAFAFPGVDSHGHSHLHSHMAAVKEKYRNRSIGSAIKWHQRDWSLEHNFKVITWTFDPLVRRNAKLNLTKLGVLVFDYYADFYGDLPDALNIGDPTDRLIAQWNITTDRVERASKTQLEFVSNVEIPVALANVNGEPESMAANGLANQILCYIPADIIEIRATDSARALKWRLAVRDVLKTRLDAGWHIHAFTEDGAYVVKKNEGGQ